MNIGRRMSKCKDTRADSIERINESGIKSSGIGSLKKDLIALFLKMLITAFVLYIVSMLVFGVFRSGDMSMSPGIGEGDLVFTYRLDKDYCANDLVVIKYEDAYQVRRVVAIAGDTVDISEKGLVINGQLQSEPDIRKQTYAYAEGISFPITLNNGEIFILADDRENATDSRYYGPIVTEDTCGAVMAVLRHNGL